MSTLAQPIRWPACCPCRSQTQATPSAPTASLLQRYARADEHERLCMWLQFREARAELDRIEAERPPRPWRFNRRLRRWLGMP